MDVWDMMFVKIPEKVYENNIAADMQNDIMSL